MRRRVSLPPVPCRLAVLRRAQHRRRPAGQQNDREDEHQDQPRRPRADHSKHSQHHIYSILAAGRGVADFRIAARSLYNTAVIDTFHYGVCYYPEHWPETMVDSDLDRIVDAGFDFVRIGEGAWAYFEPAEGQFRFDLFDRVVAGCEKRGLNVLFGTPTYCGPAWIGHTYPEVYRWDFQRTPMKHGGRRNYNYTSPKYLELTDRIVTALATHYRNAKSIKWWQIDNEFNCHMDVSYAPSDTLAFRAWLRKKYKTLDALNDAWGTKFWSQTYSDWNQLDLPHPTAAYLNPSQKLDEARFISDTVVDYCRRQVDIVRVASKRWQVTHNALFENISGPDLAGTLDFWSHDQYPRFHKTWPQANYSLIQSRSLGFPFAVLEQQSGPGGQMHYLQETPRPGQLRLWAMQSIAHGAKMLSYFCWRTCPYGSEQHWHGLIDADNKPTRRLAEAAALGRELRQMPAEAFDAPPVKTFALLRDFDNEVNAWRINNYVQGTNDNGSWSAAVQKRHYALDHVWPGSDWGVYAVVIAPHLRIVDAAVVKKMTDYVRAGGTLILSAQSATKDRNLHMRQQTPPGPLAGLSGVTVEDWTMVEAGRSFVAALGETKLELVGFVERLKPRGATVLATWDTDDTLLAGAPAITEKRVGNGRVIYVGGYLHEKAAGTLVDYVASELSLEPPISADIGVEVIERRLGRKRFLWALNHTVDTQFIDGPGGLSRKLAPYDVAVAQSQAR